MQKFFTLSFTTHKISKALSFESFNSSKKELYFPWVCLYTQQCDLFHFFSSFYMHLYVYIAKKFIKTACWIEIYSIKINKPFHFVDDFIVHFLNYVIILGFRDLRIPAIYSYPTKYKCIHKLWYSDLQHLNFEKCLSRNFHKNNSKIHF